MSRFCCQVALTFHQIAASVTNPVTLKKGLTLRIGIHSGPADSGIVVRDLYPPCITPVTLTTEANLIHAGRALHGSRPLSVAR